MVLSFISLKSMLDAIIIQRFDTCTTFWVLSTVLLLLVAVLSLLHRQQLKLFNQKHLQRNRNLSSRQLVLDSELQLISSCYSKDFWNLLKSRRDDYLAKEQIMLVV